jgi:hypothetical protein
MEFTIPEIPDVFTAFRILAAEFKWYADGAVTFDASFQTE